MWLMMSGVSVETPWWGWSEQYFPPSDANTRESSVFVRSWSTGNTSEKLLMSQCQQSVLVSRGCESWCYHGVWKESLLMIIWQIISWFNAAVKGARELEELFEYFASSHQHTHIQTMFTYLTIHVLPVAGSPLLCALFSGLLVMNQLIGSKEALAFGISLFIK